MQTLATAGTEEGFRRRLVSAAVAASAAAVHSAAHVWYDDARMPVEGNRFSIHCQENATASPCLPAILRAVFRLYKAAEHWGFCLSACTAPPSPPPGPKCAPVVGSSEYNSSQVGVNREKWRQRGITTYCYLSSGCVTVYREMGKRDGENTTISVYETRHTKSFRKTSRQSCMMCWSSVR